jgi:acyl transferase domain-containing protein
MNNDYTGAYHGPTSKVNTYTSTGISNAITASRLSYVFDLHGPCMTIDTACSASLVAVHQACLAIRSGRACSLFSIYLYMFGLCLQQALVPEQVLKQSMLSV